MKKLISVFLVVLMFISVSGCKRKRPEPPSKKDYTTTTSRVVSSKPKTESSKPETVSSTSEDTSVIYKYEPSIPRDVSSAVASEKPVEKLVGVNKLRPDYDLGNCKDLRGNITVILFYLDDFESSWTRKEINDFTEKEIKPGLKFLENSAEKYNVKLKFKIEEIHSDIYYDGKVEVNTKKSGLATINTLYTAAKALDCLNDLDFIAKYKLEYSTEILSICLFNKKGISYALNPRRGDDTDIAEHVLMFSEDLETEELGPVGWQSSVIAHETLHLYGAEDYYKPASRKAIAEKQCPGDIMLSCQYFLWHNDFGDATAFYIGWTDTPPEYLYKKGWQAKSSK